METTRCHLPDCTYSCGCDAYRDEDRDGGAFFESRSLQDLLKHVLYVDSELVPYLDNTVFRLAIQRRMFATHTMRLWFCYGRIRGNVNQRTGQVNQRTDIVMATKLRDAIRQPYGLLHGGVSLLLAEEVASVGASMVVERTMGDQYGCVGLELNGNHVASARHGVIIVHGTPIHHGRRTAVWDVRVYNRADLSSVDQLKLEDLENGLLAEHFKQQVERQEDDEKQQQRQKFTLCCVARCTLAVVNVFQKSRGKTERLSAGGSQTTNMHSKL